MDFSEPAYPCSAMLFADDGTWKYTGLTIRQQAVLMAMQGMLAGWPHDRYVPDDALTQLAEQAIEFADAVLKREADTRERSDECT